MPHENADACVQRRAHRLVGKAPGVGVESKNCLSVIVSRGKGVVLREGGGRESGKMSRGGA